MKGIKGSDIAMGGGAMKYLRAHARYVIGVLAGAISVSAGLWVNAVSDPARAFLTVDYKQLLLLAAFVFLFLEVKFIKSIETPDKRIITHILGLGVRSFAFSATANVSPSEIRAFVQIKKIVPDATGKKWNCLVRDYFKCEVTAPDHGAIPIDHDGYRKWFVNVKAFHTRNVHCEEPNIADRPEEIPGLVRLSNFDQRTVISAPILIGQEPNITAIGTLTFDSTASAEDLRWRSGGVICPPARHMITTLADLIGKVLSDEKIS